MELANVLDRKLYIAYSTELGSLHRYGLISLIPTEPYRSIAAERGANRKSSRTAADIKKALSVARNWQVLGEPKPTVQYECITMHQSGGKSKPADERRF